jgi:hypothetical protein
MAADCLVRMKESMLDVTRMRRIGTGYPALAGLVAGLVLAVLALCAGLFVVKSAAPGPRGWQDRARAAPVVSRAHVPQVEPVELRPITSGDAKAFNAQVPFSTRPNPAARAFRFAGGEEDRLRALDCLSAAVLYEAGDDPEGQKAVAQVVLNRVRHPAFPHTVCGVVFQGSERRTGCQFTFTCDGALVRSYSQAIWDRARRIADAALAGSVYKPVGQATHYHTDWVVPYWSSSLDKIVAVHTHLFFRWSGWWGTPPAFRFQATGSEPRVAQLAMRFPEHAVFGGAFPANGIEVPAGPVPVVITNDTPKPTAADPNTFAVLLSAKDAANFPVIAAFTCGNRPRCKFMGWTNGSMVPSGTSAKLTSEQLAGLSFSYLRDRSINLERALWNCAETKRPATECLWSKLPPPPAKAVANPAAPSAAAPAKLDGVRFKDEPKPALKP